jgi:flagellar biosynthesis GTPase FlhF
MEKRGYRISDEIKEQVKTGKYQTLKSLQREGYSKLYEKSTAISERGKIISGKEFRREERKESARKAARTRREKRSLDKFIERQREEYYDSIDEQPDFNEVWKQNEWEKARREKDVFDMANAQLYQEGERVYDELVRLIDQYPTAGSQSLKESLANEIRKYGKDNVLKSIGMAPQEVIRRATEIVYYEEDATAIHGAFLDLYEIISGTVPTDEEAKELGNTLDEMADFESR